MTDEIVTEKVSGASAIKIKQKELLEKLKEGNLVVVTRLDRLGRNTIQLLELVEDFKSRSVGLFVIKDGIDTRTTAGTLKVILFLVSGLYKVIWFPSTFSIKHNTLIFALLCFLSDCMNINITCVLNRLKTQVFASNDYPSHLSNGTGGKSVGFSC